MKLNDEKFKYFNGKLYCTICLEGAYGFIYRATVKNIQKKIYICDECEAVWESEEDIIKGQFIEFEHFMHKKGLKPFWSELTDIVEVW